MFCVLAVSMLSTVALPDYTKDLDALLIDLQLYGAYVRDDKIDFALLGKHYRPIFRKAATQTECLRALESVVGELHDFHASLGTNDNKSPRLVPSGTDVVLKLDGDSARIVGIRPIFPNPGQSSEEHGRNSAKPTLWSAVYNPVTTINGLKPKEAAKQWLGILPPDKRAWDWAVKSAIAGRWGEKRSLTTMGCFGAEGKFELPEFKPKQPTKRLTVESRPGGVLYLRPEDSLYKDGLISDFDRLVPQMRSAKKIVLDLRNTPSGGNTTVARGIMGIFIGKRMTYQRHVIEERDTNTVRDWVEYVTPRFANCVKTPLEVVVGHWTASMGEGLAIGFDGMKRANVIGTAMAGLRGAVSGFKLPVSGFQVFFPTEKLFHINGTPRHQWMPKADKRF